MSIMIEVCSYLIIFVAKIDAILIFFKFSIIHLISNVTLTSN